MGTHGQRTDDDDGTNDRMDARTESEVMVATVVAERGALCEFSCSQGSLLVTHQ